MNLVVAPRGYVGRLAIACALLVAVLGPSVAAPVGIAGPPGTAYGWGTNFYGELGATRTDTAASFPIKLADGSTLTGIVDIAAGNRFDLWLKSDGTVSGAGDNGYGQLGDGTNVSRNTLVQAVGLTGVTQIDAGDHHVLALKSDGTVWAWGQNFAGQVGDGTTTDRYVPVQVSG
jgi:alpha-tubulin suppressor-like RCC1 family protein